MSGETLRRLALDYIAVATDQRPPSGSYASPYAIEHWAKAFATALGNDTEAPK